MKQSVILFCGAFDPVHNGHIEMARAARDQFDATVIFIPTKTRATYYASTADRINMLNLVCTENYGFKLSTYELDNLDIPSMYDTVSHFLNDDTQLYLMLGADQVNEFHEWHSADEIVKLAKICYAPRKDVVLDFHTIEKYKMQRIFVGTGSRESSTDVRNGSLNQVPKYIKDYIKKHKLYKVEKPVVKKAEAQSGVDISDDWEQPTQQEEESDI